MRILLSLLMALVCAAASLAAAPSSLDKLFAQLKAVETADEARALESQILAHFTRSGSASIDLLMTRADAALAAGDKTLARKFYDSITAISPRYAEGWHRRGLILQDAGDDGAAMIALQKAVELNPRHFAAMAELAEMLEDFGQKGEALKLYRRALTLDPHYEGLQRHIEGLSRDVEGQGI